MKTVLLTAPTEASPGVTKPSHLYVDDKKGVAKEVLTQALRPWKGPVACLSKRLDLVATGWPLVSHNSGNNLTS